MLENPQLLLTVSELESKSFAPRLFLLYGLPLIETLKAWTGVDLPAVGLDVFALCKAVRCISAMVWIVPFMLELVLWDHKGEPNGFLTEIPRNFLVRPSSNDTCSVLWEEKGFCYPFKCAHIFHTICRFCTPKPHAPIQVFISLLTLTFSSRNKGSTADIRAAEC